jgi:hypothetical protein
VLIMAWLAATAEVMTTRPHIIGIVTSRSTIGKQAPELRP